MFDRLSVRMYSVGFGDCFLLRLWEGAKATNILIDCGSITEGRAQVSRVAADVIAECSEADGVSRLALVVATHRHKDHVGGFTLPDWGAVEVGEVWMPWTEDPTDTDATRIRNRQSALALALAGEADEQEDEPLAMRPVAGEPKPALALRAMRAIASNALTNEKAMTTLHTGFAGVPPRRFLPLKDVTCEARLVPGVPGLVAHVLGPPRDENAMKAMDPPSGAGYLRAAAGAGAPAGGAAGLLSAKWRRTGRPRYRNEGGRTTLTGGDVAAIRAQAEQPGGALAAALDKAVNNTSLILLFEIGGMGLLFPGDAQWGAWNAALQDPACRAVLGKTTFYKVGHHGSHNATPRELIETVLKPGFTAMFSTAAVPQWPDIPRPPLVTEIARRAASYARTDKEAAAAKAGFKVKKGLYVEFEAPLV